MNQRTDNQKQDDQKGSKGSRQTGDDAAMSKGHGQGQNRDGGQDRSNRDGRDRDDRQGANQRDNNQQGRGQNDPATKDPKAPALSPNTQHQMKQNEDFHRDAAKEMRDQLTGGAGDQEKKNKEQSGRPDAKGKDRSPQNKGSGKQ